MSPPKILKNLIICSAILLAAFWALPSGAEETYSNGEARISYLEGEVLLKNAETEDWIEASKNLPVKADDNLWVPAGGKAEVKFAEGSFARLAQNTALQIGKLERTENGARTELILTEGTATFVARAPYKGGMEFLVDTPNLTVRAPEEAAFRLDADNQGTSTLTVHKGTVEATTSEGTVEIGQGQAASVAQGRMNSQEQYAKDDWDRWSDRRDAMYASGKSRKYLPPALASEAADFDNNGKWIYTDDYGYVWVPTVAADWSPYNDGQWVYVGPDMVWLPDEPWGWAPSHYGRWANLPVGWAWVPPLPLPFPFWVPAAVTWFTVGDTFCWVPLAPGEFFFGWRVYGPGCFLWSDPFYSVFVTNVFVFRNCHVHGAVHGFRHHRHHRGFGHHHWAKISAADLKKASVHAPARITPTKASFNPNQSKLVPAKSLPSRQVMNKAALTKNKGLERISTTQRQAALTKPQRTGRALTTFKGTTNTTGRPQINSRTQDTRTFKPGVQNRTHLSPQAPAVKSSQVPVTREFNKGQSGVRTQAPKTQYARPERNVHYSDRTFTTPRGTSRGAPTWSSPPSNSRSGYSNRSGSGSRFGGGYSAPSRSGGGSNLGRAGGFSSGSGLRAPSSSGFGSRSSSGSSSGFRGGSQGTTGRGR